VVAVARQKTDVRSRLIYLCLLGVPASCLPVGLLCLLLGIMPGIAIDDIAPVTQRLVEQSIPPHTGIDWLSIAPIAESRSSYSGLLGFVFISLSTPLVIEIIQRFASRVVRRGPTCDCGYPDPSPVTQYTADSFSQNRNRCRGRDAPLLIRHVFGPVVFQARQRADMPLPGDASPARLGHTARPTLGRDLRADRRSDRVRSRKAKPPDHPQIPEPGVRGPRRAAANGCGMALSTHLFVPATIGFLDGGGAV
jgi:hydrogenase-4 component B